MSVFGKWVPGRIASGGTSTGPIDLGGDYEFLCIQLPALTSGTLKLQAADAFEGTYQDMGANVVAAATTGSYNDVWNLGGWRYVKVVSGAAQGAERILNVRGWNP